MVSFSKFHGAVLVLLVADVDALKSYTRVKSRSSDAANSQVEQDRHPSYGSVEAEDNPFLAGLLGVEQERERQEPEPSSTIHPNKVSGPLGVYDNHYDNYFEGQNHYNN